MYYIAQRLLDTADKVYEPGDVIPEFTSWDNMVQRAHLNQGNVERIHGDPGDLPTGRLRADIEREAREAAARSRQAAEEADALVDPESAGTADRAPDGEGEGADGEADPLDALLDGDIYSCPACDGSVFTTRGGLLKHLRKLHGGQIPARTVPKPDDSSYARTAPPPSKAAKHVDGLMSEAGAAAASLGDDE
jgi:hypothetical protein